MVALLLLPHIPPALAQTSSGSSLLELHAGYGGGGSHSDGLVGGGLTYGFGATLEGAAFATAVVARPPGRAVFAGAGIRVMPFHSAVRPYISVGPLIAVRSYAEGRLGGFASIGIDAAISGSDRRWRGFLEGRTMHGGGDWTQLVGGLRAAFR